MSKVIKSEQAEKYRITSLEFPDLDGPMPEPRVKTDSFVVAGYFKDRAVSREDGFTPSFGPRKKKPPPQEIPKPLSPQELLEKAEAEAADMVEAARAEVEAIREEARKKGRAEGLEAGQKELEDLKAEAAQRLLGAAEAVENTRGAVLEELEEELVGLVVTAASRIVVGELETNPKIVKNVVLSALKLISKTRWVKIKVNPGDLEMVEALQDRISADYPDLTKVDLVPDESVTPGGCLVVTESEEIDDTVETRLENMAQEMDRVMKGIDDER